MITVYDLFTNKHTYNVNSVESFHHIKQSYLFTRHGLNCSIHMDSSYEAFLDLLSFGYLDFQWKSLSFHLKKKNLLEF